MRTLLILCLLLRVVHADLSAALGKPLPSPDLPVGTVSVRVVAGSIASPAANMRVVFVIGDKTRVEKTDDMGRVKITGLAKGTRVAIRVDDGTVRVAGDPFDVPDDSGVRMLLSTKPLETAPEPNNDDAFHGHGVGNDCRSDAPPPSAPNPMLGKRVLDFEAVGLDGKKLKLSAVKGPLLLEFSGSWNLYAKRDLEALATLKGITVVVVMSDHAMADVRAMFAHAPPYRVVLDPPADKDGVIGAITHSYGIDVLPETLLVDRARIVRYHLVGVHDWSSPSATACIASLAGK